MCLLTVSVWAEEGLGMVGQHPTSLQELNTPWNFHIDHRFWLQPVVYNAKSWNKTTVSDVLIQDFAVDHRINSSWSVHGDIPMVFVGSKEIYRFGNTSVGAKYHFQLRSWKTAVGVDLLANSGNSTEIMWGDRGVYPNIQLNRQGVRWRLDTHAGAYWVKSFHPTVGILLQQNKDRGFGVGVNSAWLNDSTWSAASLRWTQDLEYISIGLLAQIPVWQGAAPIGTMFAVNVSYRPPELRRETDRDGDGIENIDDFCTDDPEDVDGFEDEDGCPDPDNDLDGLNDEVDICPIHAEDADGFEDEDGCPDPDNDMDNILDIVDRCPSQPETVNQYQDSDGCPDQRSHPDFDGDGLWDDRDKCPFHPEDKDGVQDSDGCPDPDSMKQWQEVLTPATNQTDDDGIEE